MLDDKNTEEYKSYKNKRLKNIMLIVKLLLMINMTPQCSLKFGKTFFILLHNLFFVFININLICIYFFIYSLLIFNFYFISWAAMVFLYVCVFHSL